MGGEKCCKQRMRVGSKEITVIKNLNFEPIDDGLESHCKIFFVFLKSEENNLRGN
jgi:hypothetical protein